MQQILPADMELSRNTDMDGRAHVTTSQHAGCKTTSSQDVFSIILLYSRRHLAGKNKDSYIIFVTVLYAQK